MSAHFFPNRPPDIMAFESRFRQHVAPLPEASRLALYEMLSGLHPNLVETRFETEDDYVLAHQVESVIAFPKPLPLIKYAHLSCGYEEWLEHKYALPGFVEVETGDVVVDCGAYVGGFSLSAAKKAGEIHVFEPDVANFRCVERNLRDAANARLNQAGLYNRDDRMLLNVSPSSVEHSLLVPDDGQVLRQEMVMVKRLDTYCKEQGIAAVDFLKIEAEGVELEVFEGLGDLRARKLAIDVSPERDGESPALEFTERLGIQGYEIRQRGHVLFAIR
jgi:FkbM family methyltransferase